MAAALRAGRPQIPCPVMLDQPYNARTVQRLGCALDILPFANLTTVKLCQALEKVFNNVKNVAGIANGLRAEIEEESDNALDQTCEILLDYVRKFE
jgi:sterol 3beta-glucosyltransferase